MPPWIVPSSISRLRLGHGQGGHKTRRVRAVLQYARGVGQEQHGRGIDRTAHGRGDGVRVHVQPAAVRSDGQARQDWHRPEGEVIFNRIIDPHDFPDVAQVDRLQIEAGEQESFAPDRPHVGLADEATDDSPFRSQGRPQSGIDFQ